MALEEFGHSFLIWIQENLSASPTSYLDLVQFLLHTLIFFVLILSFMIVCNVLYLWITHTLYTSPIFFLESTLFYDIEKIQWVKPLLPPLNNSNQTKYWNRTVCKAFLIRYILVTKKQQQILVISKTQIRIHRFELAFFCRKKLASFNHVIKYKCWNSKKW